MWVVFPVLSDWTNPQMLGLAVGEGTKREPIGLFIGLRRQDYSRPLERKTFAKVVSTLKSIGSLLAMATNQDFSREVLQAYVAQSGAAWAGLAAAHDLGNLKGAPLSLDDPNLAKSLHKQNERWDRVLEVMGALEKLAPQPASVLPGAFHVRAEIRKAVEWCRPKLEAMGITVNLPCEDAQVVGHQDPIRVFVLEELLTNAIAGCLEKRREEHSPEEMAITIAITKRETSVYVSIENPAWRGLGAKLGQIGRIRNDGGGMGIPSATKIMNRCGGNLIWRFNGAAFAVELAFIDYDKRKGRK
jgi:hypothetical protein